MKDLVFKKTVLFSALVGLIYQVVCGMAVVFDFREFYLWLRFYPFPVSFFWYEIYLFGCLIALTGVLLFLRNNKKGMLFYFIGKILVLFFLLYAFWKKFVISNTEPFFETFMAGIGAWSIYPILFILILKIENQHGNESAKR